MIMHFLYSRRFNACDMMGLASCVLLASKGHVVAAVSIYALYLISSVLGEICLARQAPEA
jgi:hypothetical protein